jgi:hypothetical protein
VCYCNVLRQWFGSWFIIRCSSSSLCGPDSASGIDLYIHLRLFGWSRSNSCKIVEDRQCLSSSSNESSDDESFDSSNACALFSIDDKNQGDLLSCGAFERSDTRSNLWSTFEDEVKKTYKGTKSEIFISTNQKTIILGQSDNARAPIGTFKRESTLRLNCP